MGLPPSLPDLPRRASVLLTTLLPLAVGFLAYVRTLGFGFVWDDHHLLVQNTVVRQPSLLLVLASDFWQEGERTDFYRPLVSLGYFAEFRLWNLVPAGYHATSVAWHLAATLAVTRMALLLFGSAVAAGLAGTIFAVHPIHTESVAFISGRPDLVAGVFMVAALHCHLRNRPRAAALLFAGALLGKETAAALPVLVLIADRLLRRPPDPWPGTARRLWPFVLITAGYLAVRWAVLGTPVAHALDSTAPPARLVGALNSLGEYFLLALAPLPAVPDRLPDLAVSPHTVAAAVVLAVLVATSLWIRRVSPVPLFLLSWFVLTLVPSSGLIPGQPPRIAERHLYVPSAAVAWLVGWAGAGLVASRRWERTRWRTALTAVASVVVLVATGATAIRAEDWRDDRSLFTRMADAEPRSYLAAVNLAYLHLDRHQVDEAEPLFRRALALRTDAPAALLGLAVSRSRMGDHDGAVHYAQRARARAPDGDLVHAQLGVIYGIAGRYPDAVASFREAIRRNPRRFHPRAQLVLALADAGEPAQALLALREAERLLAGQRAPLPAEIAMLRRARARVSRPQGLP